MKRVITAHITYPDGTSNDVRHESLNNPYMIAGFICGIVDERPGTAIQFTVTSTPDTES